MRYSTDDCAALGRQCPAGHSGGASSLGGVRAAGLSPCRRNLARALVPDYLDCFKSDASKAEVMDELEFHYGEMDAEVRRERLERIGLIGAPGVCFEDPEEDDEPRAGDSD